MSNNYLKINETDRLKFKNESKTIPGEGWENIA